VGYFQVSRSRSDRLYQRASRVLVGGVNSPVRAFKAVGGNPVFVESMTGSLVYDVNGNEYVDLVGSWGTAVLGHSHPEVVAAVREAATKGLSFGACHEAEVELAEIIIGAFPGMELVRFVNSGTEATMSAIRLARGVTMRSKVLKFEGCYHGHVDSLLVATGSGGATLGAPYSAGVPDCYAGETLLARYNDLVAVQRIMERSGSEIAAIIVEPVAGNMGYVEPTAGFLEELRSLCDRYGSLLVFDEVMTGFRVAWGGYQKVCDVRSDLTCLGKVIGGGLPVAAYGGSRDLMEHVSPLGTVYQAGTLSGNPLGMAAGIATLRLCGVAGFYERLGEIAAALTAGVERAASAADVALRTGYSGGMLGMAFSPRPVRDFDGARRCDHGSYAKFFREMLNRGIWLPPSGYEAMFISAAHSERDVDRVVSAAHASFAAMAA
jgi:glutamate-1-semialdehyde 2,1-aminomutase